MRVLGEDVGPVEDQIRLLSRKLDRSRQAANPSCYGPDGTVKKGWKKWSVQKTTWRQPADCRYSTGNGRPP